MQHMERVHPILDLWLISVEEEEMKTRVCWRALTPLLLMFRYQMWCVYLSLPITLRQCYWQQNESIKLTVSMVLFVFFFFWVVKPNLLFWLVQTCWKIRWNEFDEVQANTSDVRGFFHVSANMWEESEGLCLRICESQAKPEELQPHNSRPAVSRISSSIGLLWAACISCPTHFFTAAAVARPAVLPPAAPCAFTSRRLPAGALYSCFSRGRLLISRCSCYGWFKKKMETMHSHLFSTRYFN